MVLKTISAGVLDVAYEEAVAPNSRLVILVHGFPKILGPMTR